MLICYSCGVGVSPSCIRKHRQTKHSDKTPTTDFIDSLVKAFDLRLTDYFDVGDGPKNPVPGILWQGGLKCGFEQCGRCLRSTDNMRKHIRSNHKLSLLECPPSECSTQILFESNQRVYEVDIIPSPSAPPITSAFDILLSQYEQKKFDQFQIPNNPALLNPFLAKYKWLNTLEGISPAKVTEWVKFPIAGDPYAGLFSAVKLYYEPIIKDMGNLEKYTTILRFVHTTKGWVFGYVRLKNLLINSFSPLVNEPFKLPMRDTTTQRYFRTVTQLIAFLLRAIRNPEIKINLTLQVLDLGKEIDELLRDSGSSQNVLNDAIHELIMAVLNRPFGPKSSADCPLSRFITFINVLPSGQIQEPDRINGCLTDLKWPCRASTFREIILQLDRGDESEIKS